MRGHENVIAMRKAGKRPAMVFVNDWPCNVDWFETGDHATVCVAGDNPESLDTRFSVGLAISISSECEKRARALSDAFKRHADVVAAHHHKPGAWFSQQNGWTEVWRRSNG